MSLFCLSHSLVYLFYFCASWNRSKINKQGYGLGRKGHENRVYVLQTTLFQVMLKFKHPVQLYLYIMDISISYASLISINLGVSKLLALHHKAADLLLT